MNLHGDHRLTPPSRLVGMTLMRTDDARPVSRRIRLDNPAGLVVEALEHGALSRFEVSGTSLLLHPANPAEAGPANVHLRRHEGGPDGTARHVALLGPTAPSNVSEDDGGLTATGAWGDLAYRLTLRLAEAEAAWCWRLEVTNHGSEAVRVDAVLTHDPALAPPGAVHTNEYYVSQYLDISPIETTDHGVALGVRQNMPGPRSPWLLVGSLRRGTGWATDAHQLVERTTEGVRWTGLEATDLPGRRLQHEHALVALQDDAVHLDPGATHRTGFVGIVVEHHPEATGPDDARLLGTALACFSVDPDPGPVPAIEQHMVSSYAGGAAALLGTAATLHCRPLTGGEIDALGPTDRPGEPCEMVTAAKELAVLRPHGQILRTGDALVPDAASLTSTVWMAGTFHSQVTRGHAGRDALVSGRRSYLGLFRSHGVRILLRPDDESAWRLLDTPSAWRAGLDACWWWYATADGLLVEVVARAPSETHELGLEVRVLAGSPQQLKVTVHLDADRPAPTFDGGRAEVGGWRLAWDDGATASVGVAWFVLDAPATSAWRLGITAASLGDDGPLEPAPASRLGAGFWAELTGSLSLTLPGSSPEAAEVAAIASATPWFTHNALVHYLAPRGLEQFTGGAWGTRDVCQGPVGLLTALDRHDEVRDVLLRVLRAQNYRGDWPQAFEFLPPQPDSGQQDSHGDVVYWPLLAVGEHLQATADAGLLEEKVPYVGDDGPTPPATVEEHLERALARIEELAVPGTPLPAYGHGDWNDSLQPADTGLAQRLASTWTAVLQVQALDALASGLSVAAAAPGLAGAARALAVRTRAAIGETMLLGGVMPGYLLFPSDGTKDQTPEPVVHPRDARTGLTYGILPWVHAVAADVLEPEAARQHLALIEEHLLGPDGARLFDRPVAYRGGPMSVFQRAEASTFWGREIGLMYVHAHLRYAEALARVGDGAGLLRALALASPWGLEERVPQSRPRQRSCYYSSSDGVFADRYDAQERYPDLMAGEVPLEGGWRIYSSGPGLALRLVVERLLGVRRRGDLVEIDPVLPAGCDGLRADVRIAGQSARVRFAVGPEGVGCRRVVADGRELTLTPLDNPHRRPGVAVRTDHLRAALAAGPDLIVETH